MLLEIIISWFAWFGLFCFFMAIGGLVLFIKACHDFAIEDKRRSQPTTQSPKTKAMREADDIISRMF